MPSAIFWTNRGHSPPPAVETCLHLFWSRIGFGIVSTVRLCPSNVATVSHALALSANQFLCKEKVPNVRDIHIIYIICASVIIIFTIFFFFLYARGLYPPPSHRGGGRLSRHTLSQRANEKVDKNKHKRWQEIHIYPACMYYVCSHTLDAIWADTTLTACCQLSAYRI